MFSKDCATGVSMVGLRARRARFIGLAATLLSTATSFAGAISTYNLVVTGNLDSTSEVEGRTFVGGTLTGSASNYGIGLLPAANYAGTDTLTVGGAISVSNINISTGNVRHGSTVSGNVNLNGPSNPQNIFDPSVPSLIPGIASELATTSNALAALSANSTASLPNGNPGPGNFNAAPSGPNNLAVFSVSGAAAFSNSFMQTLHLNAAGASAIVVNVSGTNITFNQGNMDSSWQAYRSKLIWNFYQATSLSIDRAFNGAILAPNANLTNSTNIDGSVFVASFTQRGEVHLPNYTGYTPEPASMFVLGLAVLGLRRR